MLFAYALLPAYAKASMSSPPHPPAGFQRVINLHNTVSEASAALYIPDEHSIWTLGDSGCGTLL
ncbi:MAG: hypothetical protein GY868_08025, partial [Deltaproteobacteria bacterium]|nr:hypothetical protein [Deltaproteobacteria bacterium]